MNKLISNYLFNSIYQLLILILPFVTMPYVSRALGPEGIGINAYSFSIIQIFILFAVLGIPLYGNKEIATVKNSGVNNISKQFWSIYVIQVVSSIIISVAYFLFVYFYIDEMRIIYYLQWIMLFAAMLDISWLLIGLEELKKAVLRNMIIKLLSVVLIFSFIKDENDLVNYILIISLSNLIGQLAIWTQAAKYIKKVKINKKLIKAHCKPMMLVFVPQAIIQLYIILDRVILGTMSTEIEVAYYDQALKIVKVTLGLITSISTVMLPRIASEYAGGNLDKIKSYNTLVLKIVVFLTLPMVFGLATISLGFTTWFFGSGYDKVGVLILILSPIIFFIGLSNVFGMQILLPTNQQKKMIFSVSAAAVLSLSLNIILINYFASIATAFATLIAEFTVTCIQFVFLYKYLNVRDMMRNISKYGSVSILMGGILLIVGNLFDNSMYLTFMQIIIGIILYLGVLFLFKDKLIWDVILKLKRGKR
ncbi:flippase [Paenibacillus riograndensis]|uniref:Polysaccharide biosynthesis protein n=1 Tax=Paenibacillus riograndensis SBR5 TaxID=1073571 RepID=A0A0E4CYT3_9BACL|nr:flippase [Paenibacillus riograndensis]CQR57842.1 polysaccharide biosynthesis protein [Paenibacillus riograndensis SBR5]